ncbi:rod shape-determining protein MreC [Oikeobacillus pervagus]|uniref:Cell shape-determining protein MreC n=1 Tax=Oikeobacillus pervagus TaxID=1325931 RepID=A0AAJ1SXG7_9BACI|nr:rod shape-determining protein MreC [Oikeobacillus pervagus]MDQ0214555.1 rod shape-determining protein MreC [Oikeobacillus pervagus]
MPQFFMNKRLIIMLVSIIVVVALIGFSIRDRENISWPEQFVKDIVGLGQVAVSTPANAVSNFFKDLKNLQNTYKENEKLKEHLNRMTQVESDVNRLEKDNKELRALLDKKESLADYNPEQATVISRNPDRWFDVFTINKGRSNGIQPDMAVMTSKGLIGKVKNVSKFTATVEMLSANDPKNRVSAIIQDKKKNLYGLIEGYDKENGYLLMKVKPTEGKMKKGKSVTTSGLGGVFPDGLAIGKVVKLEPDHFGLTQIAYIKPSADFYDFEHVVVAKRGMPVVKDTEEKERQQVVVEEEGL